MKKTIIGAVSALFAITMLSFTFLRGGEGFEISLDGKMLLQRYNTEINDVRTLSLPAISMGEELSIRYHHCGRVGKNRTLRVKDADNKMLNEWTFPDGNATPMQVKVKQLAVAAKTPYLKLYYSSNELPNGKLLAFLTKEKKVTATP